MAQTGIPESAYKLAMCLECACLKARRTRSTQTLPRCRQSTSLWIHLRLVAVGVDRQDSAPTKVTKFETRSHQSSHDQPRAKALLQFCQLPIR